MVRRYKNKQTQEDAESNELLKRVRSLTTHLDVCNLVSERVSSGVEKCMDPDSNKDAYHNLFLVVSHALSKVHWKSISPSFAELDF